MQHRSWSRILMVPVLAIFIGSACEGDVDEDAVGALVGEWDIVALSGSYNRVVDLPAGWTDPDSFVVSARWDLAPLILQADSALADLDLVTFRVGDVLLDTTVSWPTPAALAATGISIKAIFTDLNTYTLSGFYPTLRLDPNACRTALEIASIQDAGAFTMDYNAGETGGTLTIVPNIGDQVLPPFNDGAVTFTNSGNTLGLNFTDLDAHETLFAAAGHTWSEDLRVTMGIADLPISALGAFAESGSTVNNTAYIMNAAFLLRIDLACDREKVRRFQVRCLPFLRDHCLNKTRAWCCLLCSAHAALYEADPLVHPSQ